ncbi:zinc-binding alcohol dehydrogenase family protein [uncultured Ruegeria sp.]|uniref:zinc-binding alcohol dehydrogenase family protein n=1 Tax=uncultured Ruegeria sp. TaxID=259304 RepID=UPI00260DAC55|nr:zinc-binding alcohol dehydrogenase family protein [uncultured Ruegeria sp.]
MSAPTRPHGAVIEPGTFVVEQRVPQTDLPEGWALINICSVGLCGTDYHIFEGKHPFLEYPRVIGHELSGRLASDVDGFAKGELVVINPYLSCDTCHSCKLGKRNCCSNIEVLGVHRDGGMTPQIAVPVNNLIRAEGLSAQQAAMVEFLAIGAHAVQRSNVAAGARVLVTGVGPIGIGVALFARLKGAEVVLLDVSEERLAAVQTKFGFSQGFTSVSAAIDGVTGFDVVFDATGHRGAIEAGFAAVAFGGTYVLVSVVKETVTFSDPEFHKREMTLLGSRNALQADFDWVLSAMRAGDIDTDELCSAVMPLEDLPAQMESLARDRSGLIKVIVTLGD